MRTVQFPGWTACVAAVVAFAAAGRAADGRMKLKVLFAAVLPRDRTQVFRLTDGGGRPRPWRPVEVRPPSQLKFHHVAADIDRGAL